MTDTLDFKTDTLYKFEPFFELSHDLLCIAGFDGYFKRINPAVSRLLGYSNEELYSRPINDFIYSEDRNITSLQREQLKLNNPIINFENRYLTKSGEIVWLHWTSMPLVKDELVYAIAKNITHKKKLEELRNNQLTHLTNSNKEIRQLTYTTAHDLRAPVNNLFSFLNLLDLSAINDEETLEVLSLVQSLGENLKQTLDNSIDTLIEKDKFHTETEELNLGDSLNLVLQSISSLIKSSGAIISSNFSELENIRFNKAYLESVFLNLITNSIKYSRPGYAPHISIFSRKENGVSQLTISDNGLGFDTDQLKDKLFGFGQKFHSHADSKGIGLYLVYNHITSLGGQIALESRPNEGATFTLSFKD